MKTSNTTDAPRPTQGLRNFGLLVLHVVVLAVSLWVHPPTWPHADRALPQDI
jgi:hypothetical protein